jgi:hypothetical protein
MALEVIPPGKQKYNKALINVDDLHLILLKNQKDGKHQMWEVVKVARPSCKEAVTSEQRTLSHLLLGVELAAKLPARCNLCFTFSLSLLQPQPQHQPPLPMPMASCQWHEAKVHWERRDADAAAAVYGVTIADCQAYQLLLLQERCGEEELAVNGCAYLPTNPNHI